MPAHTEATDAWRALRAELRRRVGAGAFDVWFTELELAGYDGHTIVLRGRPETERWVSRRYGRLLDQTTEAVLGDGVRLRIGSGPAGEGTDRPPRGSGPSVPGLPGPRTGFTPRYRFEQFVIGETNRLAHAAALAVAENPGQAYNPLFLHAPPGLGKTHLLHAIGNYLTDHGDGASVRYATAETFTNDFVTALGTRSIDVFKQAYRSVDVLLVDDVQFLADKARTEEEFFHTFNALYDNGRQLVLTCDRLPRALTSIEQRLRERFEAGLVADIAPPDHATRVTILRKRAALDAVVLADVGVLDLVADRVTENIRSLEGALIRIVAFGSLRSRAIDLPLATEVLDAMYPISSTAGRGGRSAPPTVAEIQSAVAAHFELSVAQLTSASRAARVNWARQVAIHLVREITGQSLPAIGQAFGGRNHATVLHACRRVGERLESDADAVQTVDSLRRSITQPAVDRGC